MFAGDERTDVDVVGEAVCDRHGRRLVDDTLSELIVDIVHDDRDRVCEATLAGVGERGANVCSAVKSKCAEAATTIRFFALPCA